MTSQPADVRVTPGRGQPAPRGSTELGLGSDRVEQDRARDGLADDLPVQGVRPLAQPRLLQVLEDCHAGEERDRRVALAEGLRDPGQRRDRDVASAAFWSDAEGEDPRFVHRLERSPRELGGAVVVVGGGRQRGGQLGQRAGGGVNGGQRRPVMVCPFLAR